MSLRKPTPTLVAALLAIAGAAHGQSSRPQAPSLSSRAGAAYTMYLDFEGFNYTGGWGNEGSGQNYATYGNASGNFDAARQSQIKTLWARVAEKYAAFNINVTTVDPARTAGVAPSDPLRQAYYDSTARVTHTIVTPTGAADNSTAGGVSWVGSAQYAFNTSGNGGAGYGYHTNFVFAPANPIYDMDFAVKTMAESTAHENGHALGLNHQSDYNANGSLREEYSTNYGTGGGWGVDEAPAGSFAPVMGFSTFHQRGLWRSGRVQALGGGIQDDVATLYGNDGMGGPVEDGIGNSFAEATELALSGTGTVDSSLAKGIVVPTSTSVDPLDPTSYQGGFFRFHSSGGGLTLRANNGGSFLEAGVADPGMTLESELRIYDASRNLVGTATEDALTRWTEFSGNLSAGTYYAVVTSTGGFSTSLDRTARYYNMGSYFLSGSGFAPVPEPASLAALALGAGALLRRRKRA